MSDFERLPTHIVPINYNLVIRIDSNEFKFYGIVSIDLKVYLNSFKVIIEILNDFLASRNEDTYSLLLSTNRLFFGSHVSRHQDV